LEETRIPKATYRYTAQLSGSRLSFGEAFSSGAGRFFAQRAKRAMVKIERVEPLGGTSVLPERKSAPGKHLKKIQALR